MLSKILIGIVIILGLGGYFLYNKNIELNKLNSAFELRDAEQKQAIKSITENFERQSAALSSLSEENAKIQGEMNRYLDIFRRHNLSKLAAAKPGLIEPKFNSATKEVFDGIEADSISISNLNK
jgi:hypothetical protein